VIFFACLKLLKFVISLPLRLRLSLNSIIDILKNLRFCYILINKIKNIMGLTTPNQPNKYKQGRYELINPDKYVGNKNWIVYRSGWEFMFCRWADLTKEVKKWGSEIIAIPYFDSLGKEHKYYPDFYIELEKEGIEFKWVIEIKPKKETAPPKKPLKENKRSIANYNKAIETYQTNIFKWKAAVNYCNSRNMEFKILTEDIIFSKMKL
jgi:hypothetical protein